MNILERTRIEKTALEHGWENIITSDDMVVLAGSARHHAQATITRPTSREWHVTFNKPLLTKKVARDYPLTDAITSVSARLTN